MAGRSGAGLCTVSGADVPSSSEPVALKPGHEGDGGRYTDGLRCAQLPSAGPATSHHVCRSCAGNLRCWSPSRPSRTWREPGVAARGGAQPRRSRGRREARVVAAVRERGGLVAAARPASASRRASSRCRPALASCCAHRRCGARRVGAAGHFGGCAVGLAPTPLWSRPAAWFPSFSMAFVCVLGSLGASAGARRRCRVVYRSQTHQINSMHLLNTRPPRNAPTRTQATERPQWAPAATRHRDEVVRGRRWRAAPLRRGDSRVHRCASIVPGRRRRSGTL